MDIAVAIPKLSSSRCGLQYVYLRINALFELMRILSVEHNGIWTYRAVKERV